MVITKRAPEAAASPRPLIAGIVLGAALGAGIGWAFYGSPGAERASPAPIPSGPFADDPGIAPSPELATVHVALDEDAVRTLQRARDRAIAKGGIEQRPDDFVTGTIRVEGAGEDPDPVRATIRLKGDWTDHIDTDKWSLRIELEGGRRFGTRRFSVQHPKTRGYVTEWLIMEMARREGLLAPRGRYVDVVVNDRPNGVHYLEEHFGKELLESQGRREGPIVRFREDSLWSTWLQHDFRADLSVPNAVEVGADVSVAEIDAFERNRLEKSDPLNARMVRALGMLRDAQRLLTASTPHFPGGDHRTTIRRLEALDELEGRTIDDLFDAEKLGHMLAIATLWEASHGLGWPQMRFYHDPIADRLEPVLFDMEPNFQALVAREDLLLANPLIEPFTRSDRVWESGFRALWRISGREHLDAFFADVGDDYARYTRAILADETVVPPPLDGRDLLESFRRALYEHADWIRSVLEPRDAANFSCRLTEERIADDQEVVTLDVEAWATTRIPVVIDGFRFSNGRFVPAAEVCEPDRESLHRPEGGVALPRLARRVQFRIPADLRLIGLRRVQEIKQALRAAIAAGDGSVRLELTVVYHLVPSGSAREELLPLLRVGDDPDRGRPPYPTLEAVLERHACLGYDPRADELYVRAGSWDVGGHLVLPEGRALRCRAGAMLRFEEGAVLLANGPLELAADEPIVLEGRDGGTWGGIVVLDAGGTSAWRNVVVRRTSEVAEGGWQTTGGVTFYHSPAHLEDCRFEDARGEDSLNVFGTTCELSRCTFEGGASDLFDGDFVDGEARDCRFEGSAGDGVDLCGSSFRLAACIFDGCGDKAISIGEGSEVEIDGCNVGRCWIAVAAKDDSTVRIDGLAVRSAEQYALCAYVKKPEFGPSRIVATKVRVDDAGKGLYLVQDGCRLELDGQPVPTRAIDVDALYRQGILGK